MPLILRPPTLADEPHARALHEQLVAEGFDFLLHTGTWEEILALYERDRRAQNLPPGWVGSEFLFAELNNAIVGRISLRYELNDYLSVYGGHIGYAVAPDFRGQGIATAILRQGLKCYERWGVDKVLITCEEENVASAKVIEKCGGQLEDTVTHPASGKRMLRYWIAL